MNYLKKSLFLFVIFLSFTTHSELASWHKQKSTIVSCDEETGECLKRTCMTGHSHSGTGKHDYDEKLAVKEAKKHWMGFTAFEYGQRWGNIEIAKDFQFSCEQNPLDGPGVTCNITAKPCREEVVFSETNLLD